MIPPSPSGSMGRRLVLEWRTPEDADEQVWLADLGPFRIEVWWSGHGWPWQIGLPAITHDGVDAAFKREIRFVESTKTRESAQLAAEEACKALLCSALAAFAPEMGPDVCLNYEIDGEAGFGTYDHYAKASPDDARSLALSLLRASESTSHGGER